MRFTNDGLTMWYGREDAPAPTHGEVLPPGEAITIGVCPPHPSYRVTVRYRVDGGIVQERPAIHVNTEHGDDAGQFFRATFSDLPAGAFVEYLPILSCGGRRCPDLRVQRTLPSCFRTGAPSPAQNSRGAMASVPETAASPQRGQIAFSLEFLFTVTVQLHRNPEIIGEVPGGLEVNWFLQSGTVVGPRLNASCLHGGDWMTIRRDGIGEIDIRSTIETDDGVLIAVTETGVCDFGEDGYRNCLRRQWPRMAPVRTSPCFLAAHPRYLWLNRLQCIGVGEVRLDEYLLHYDAYAVR